MKNLLKLEGFGLLIFFSTLYFNTFNGSWLLYLCLFFVPDITFLFYMVSSKIGGYFYNFLHHQGLLVLIFIIGMYCKNDTLLKIGLIFLSHSSFDRLLGYGLKYPDSFFNTHLGWIGKGEKGK